MAISLKIVNFLKDKLEIFFTLKIKNITDGGIPYRNKQALCRSRIRFVNKS